MAFIPEPYEIPAAEWANASENSGNDATLHFSINDGATVIEAYGIEAEYGIVYVGGLCVETCFSPNLPDGGLDIPPVVPASGARYSIV